ncbi:MAG: hypothetical protein MHM6MM_007677, partial [Cercozoa sp. M6MM]
MVFRRQVKQLARLAQAERLQVDKSGPAGWAPLHVAVANRDVEMVRFLLSNNADVNVADVSSPRQGHTSFFEEVFINGERVHRSNGGNEDGLPWYETQRVRQHQMPEVNPHAVTTGFTPLHYAVLFPDEDFEILKMLLEQGADVKALDASGQSPIVH